VIGDLKPHAAYKDSGQDWLGSIPAHWGLLRAKRLFREVDERSKTGKEELLSVSHLTGVTPRRLKNVTMFMAESNVGHKVCRPGDLVINTLWAWMAALGVTQGHWHRQPSLWCVPAD
jgi:type I restriction enzyme S subunit